MARNRKIEPALSGAEMLAICRERAQAVVDEAIKNGTWRGVTSGSDAVYIPQPPKE